MTHISVLLHEAISGLEPQKGDVIVDGTLGNGGHTQALCDASNGNATILAFDRDEDSIKRAQERLKGSPCNIVYINDNFRNVESALYRENVPVIHKALFDLGFSSDQIESSGRGFSFMRDEPLIMTYEKEPHPGALTAYDVVNTWEEESLRDIIYGFGEEKFAGRIAKAIITSREIKPIETTKELRDLIFNATPGWYRRQKIHPATKTFQALRIAVNDELRSLEEGLRGTFKRLAPGGRMAVISFHSLEDRIVKRMFKEYEKEGLVLILTKRPVRPSAEEVTKNPRSRSAKLRIIQKK